MEKLFSKSVNDRPVLNSSRTEYKWFVCRLHLLESGIRYEIDFLVFLCFKSVDQFNIEKPNWVIPWQLIQPKTQCFRFLSNLVCGNYILFSENSTTFM